MNMETSSTQLLTLCIARFLEICKTFVIVSNLPYLFDSSDILCFT